MKMLEWNLFITMLSAMVLVAVIGLGGCGDDDDDGDTDANISVIHLSPDAPGVDVYVDETGPVVTNLEFPDGTEWLELDEGTYDIDVSPTGTSVDDSVLGLRVTLGDGEAYTVAAYDEAAKITALLLLNNLETPAAGMIRVRPIHTAAGVGEVDIWDVSDPDAGVELYSDVDFGNVGIYSDLAAGAYSLGLDLDNDGMPELVFDTPELAAGTIANIFAVKDGADVFLNVQLQDATVLRIDPK